VLMSNRRFIAQNDTETYTICLFEPVNLALKRAEIVGVNAIKHYLKRVCLVAIATILSKTFTIRHSLFMNAIAHNRSFFTIFMKNLVPFRVLDHVKSNRRCHKKCQFFHCTISETFQIVQSPLSTVHSNPSLHPLFPSKARWLPKGSRMGRRVARLKWNGKDGWELGELGAVCVSRCLKDCEGLWNYYLQEK